jgi:hypothetical protein
MEGLRPVYRVAGEVYKSGNVVPQADLGANGYRLPTEAEWEWAARGGTATSGFIYSGSNNIDEVAWYQGNNTPEGTKLVGLKKSNELGISDMTGNAWEYCWPLTGNGRAVNRGGGCFEFPNTSHITFRNFFTPPTGLYVNQGFRVVRSALNSSPSDSDGDGVNDYREGKDSTDPYDPASFNPLSKGLLAYYPFDSGLLDESGLGKNLDQTGSYELVEDLTGGAGNSLRRPSRVSSGAWSSSETGVSGNAQRTISFWFYSDGSQPWPSGIAVVAGGNAVAIDRGQGIIQIDNNYKNVTTPPVDSLHQRLHHFVWTYQNKLGDSRFYLNGQPVDLVFDPGFGGPETTLDDLPDSQIFLGNDSDRGFQGNLDDVRVYNRALSATEVGQLYQSEAGALDSDGDGLTDAWERGFGRYQIIQGSFTWEQAKLHAEAKGGHLATVTSRVEHEILVRLALASYNPESARFWLGGNDKQVEGTWQWVTEEDWGFEAWDMFNRPPDNSGNEDYLTFGVLPGGDSEGEEGSWNDMGASFRNERFPYIFEFGYPTDPFNPDSDGDGYNDKFETDAGTDPNNPTSVPVPPDTDGDGVNDYREIRDGTDPGDPNSFNPLSKGLVAYYPFESNANDESGYGDRLILSGASLSPDRFQNAQSALLAESAGGPVAESAKAMSIQGNAERTISFWVRMDALSSENSLGIGWGAPSAPGNSSLLSAYGDGVVSFWGHHADLLTAVEANFVGFWRHVTFVYSDSLATGKAYVDGREKPFALGNQNLRDDLDTLSTALKISGWGFSETQSSASIDEIRVYSRALTAEEALQLYIAEAADLDSDNDGLADVHETNTGTFVSATDAGTDPYNPDTSGDGILDGEAVQWNFNPLTDHTQVLAFLRHATGVQSGRFGMYTESSIMDLNLGGVVLQKTGNSAQVSFKVQSKMQLTDPTWTDRGTYLLPPIDMPGSKGFLRIRAEQP